MTNVWEKRFLRTNVGHGIAKRFIFPVPRIKPGNYGSYFEFLVKKENPAKKPIDNFI
jgi:hypothetical protein